MTDRELVALMAAQLSAGVWASDAPVGPDDAVIVARAILAEVDRTGPEHAESRCHRCGQLVEDRCRCND